MKYYELHDEAYQRRLAAGRSGWDAGPYEDFDLRQRVEQWLADSGIAPQGATALDIGCGTGALAGWLYERGFVVTGIDIAATALSEARRQAAARSWRIDYRREDICATVLPAAAYDLIIDSHCLHCLAFDEDRRSFLVNVARALKPAGEFWMETMVGRMHVPDDGSWRRDPAGVVWYRAATRPQVAEAVERDGHWWFPTRRVVQTPAVLRAELAAVGLACVWQQSLGPAGPNDTGVFRARCRPV